MKAILSFVYYGIQFGLQLQNTPAFADSSSLLSNTEYDLLKIRSPLIIHTGLFKKAL